MVVSIAPGFGQPRPNRRGEARGLHVYEVADEALRILTYIWREDGWGLTAVRTFPRGREPLAFESRTSRTVTPLSSATPGNGAVDQQQDDRADDRRQPGADVEELVQRVAAEEGRGEEAAEHGTDDPDDRRDDEAARVVPGQERLGDAPAIAPRMMNAMIPNRTSQSWCERSGTVLSGQDWPQTPGETGPKPATVRETATTRRDDGAAFADLKTRLGEIHDLRRARRSCSGTRP